MAGTTSDKLALLRQIKEAFRAAITGKGQTISDDEPYSAWPAKVSAIQTGIDTSDATATAADMASGKTAYVNGKKVTGNVSELKAGAGEELHYYDVLASDVSVISRGKHGIDRLCRRDSFGSVAVPFSAFGDATAADVASGKTFTSVAGLKVTGTASGGNRRISDHISTGITIQDNYTLVIQHEQISPNTLVALFVRAYWSTLSTDEVIGACVFVQKNEFGPYGDTLLSIMGNRSNYVDYSFVNVSPILEEGKITIRLNGEGYAGAFNSSARYAFQFLYET